MNKEQWREYHGFTQEEMDEIVLRRDGTNGTIVDVVYNPTREVLRVE